MAYRRGTRPYGDEFTINDRLRRMTVLTQKVYESSLAGLEKWHNQPKLQVPNITRRVPDITRHEPDITHRVPNIRPQEDPQVPTSVDDAFTAVGQLMSQISHQCQRYHRNNPPHHEDRTACYHCMRFHSPQNTATRRNEDRTACSHCNHFHAPPYTATRRGNPLQESEDVHLLVPPGNYAVTASRQGSSQRKSHMVHVRDKETVELDFVL